MNRSLLLSLGLLFAPVGALAADAVDYAVDGEVFEGAWAAAHGSARGLVVVVHDWDGLTDYELTRLDMLAQLGYDAFAVDLYGKGNRPADFASRRAESGKLYADRALMRQRLMAGLDAARERSAAATVVMGYCFGGAAALELARSALATDVMGYGSFHGGLATPEGQSYPADTPPILVLHGGADTAVSMEELAGFTAELEATGLTYEVQVYSGAPHAFTVFGSDRYRERADTRSWQAFQEFLEEQLGASGS